MRYALLSSEMLQYVTASGTWFAFATGLSYNQQAGELSFGYMGTGILPKIAQMALSFFALSKASSLFFAWSFS